MGAYEVVLIGASTGGPRALLEVLPHLPEDFGPAVVIAQHMPAGFTKSFAERLRRSCAIAVAEAADGDPVLPRRVLVAPGGCQTSVERHGTGLVVRVVSAAGSLFHHPSIDHLFHSAVAPVGDRAIAVVLTGMGDDGARGAEALHGAGALTIVESRDTAIVYGMPRAAARSADRTLRLEEIGPTLAALCRTGRGEGRGTPRSP